MNLMYPPEVPFSAFLLVDVMDHRCHQEFVDDGKDHEESKYTHWSNVASSVAEKSMPNKNTYFFNPWICLFHYLTTRTSQTVGIS